MVLKIAGQKAPPAAEMDVGATAHDKLGREWKVEKREGKKKRWILQKGQSKLGGVRVAGERPKKYDTDLDYAKAKFEQARARDNKWTGKVDMTRAHKVVDNVHEYTARKNDYRGVDDGPDSYMFKKYATKYQQAKAKRGGYGPYKPQVMSDAQLTALKGGRDTLAEKRAKKRAAKGRKAAPTGGVFQPNVRSSKARKTAKGRSWVQVDDDYNYNPFI